VASSPTAQRFDRPHNRRNADRVRYPYVLTTYRLTEHHTAGGMSRFLQYLTELQPAMFVEVSPELAAERGLSHLDWAHVVTSRAAVEARVFVTDRLTPLRVDDRIIHQIWMPYHWGRSNEAFSSGDSANDLFCVSLDPNVLIQESKVGTCDIRPGRRPTGQALLDYLAEYRGRAGVVGDHYPPIITTEAWRRGNGG